MSTRTIVLFRAMEQMARFWLPCSNMPAAVEKTQKQVGDQEKAADQYSADTDINEKLRQNMIMRRATAHRRRQQEHA